MQELKSIDFVKQLAPLQINLFYFDFSAFCLWQKTERLDLQTFPFFWCVGCHFMMKETRLRRQIRSKMYAFEADFKKKGCDFRTSCPPFGSASLILFFFVVARTCIPSAEARSMHSCSVDCTLVRIVRVLSLSLCTQVLLPSPSENRLQREFFFFLLLKSSFDGD